MEYFFVFDEKNKKRQFLIILFFSIFFHVCIAFFMQLLAPVAPQESQKLFVHLSPPLSRVPSVKNGQHFSSQQRKKVLKKQNVEKKISFEKRQSSLVHKPKAPVAQTEEHSLRSKELFAAESTVDQNAQCSLPEINLSDDAVNAGITSGTVVIDVQIDSLGKVQAAKLVKGTGYDVDGLALRAAKNLLCKPATLNKEKVGVLKRLHWMIIP
jgi:TonB family protein